MATTIDISGLDINEVLAALFTGVTTVGMGAFDNDAYRTMTPEEAAGVFRGEVPDAQLYVSQMKNIGWVHGKPIKIDFSKNPIDVTEFDGYHGAGKAQELIAPLRRRQQ